MGDVEIAFSSSIVFDLDVVGVEFFAGRLGHDRVEVFPVTRPGNPLLWSCCCCGRVVVVVCFPGFSALRAWFSSLVALLPSVVGLGHSRGRRPWILDPRSGLIFSCLMFWLL